VLRSSSLLLMVAEAAQRHTRGSRVADRPLASAANGNAKGATVHPPSPLEEASKASASMRGPAPAVALTLTCATVLQGAASPAAVRNDSFSAKEASLSPTPTWLAWRTCFCVAGRVGTGPPFDGAPGRCQDSNGWTTSPLDTSKESDGNPTPPARRGQVQGAYAVRRTRSSMSMSEALSSGSARPNDQAVGISSGSNSFSDLTLLADAAGAGGDQSSSA
jgi:hypothetical protein